MIGKLNTSLISNTIELKTNLKKEINESCSLISNTINLTFVLDDVLTKSSMKNLSELKDLTLTEAKSTIVFDLFQN